MDFVRDDLGEVNLGSAVAVTRSAELAHDLTGAAFCGVAWTEDTGGIARFDALAGPKAPDADVRRFALGLARTALRDNTDVIVSGDQTARRWPWAMRGLDGVGLPLRGSQREPMGALCVCDTRGRTWNRAQILPLRRVADSLADLARASLYQQVSHRLWQEQKDVAYAISHELKSPANTLNLMLQELKLTEPDLTPASTELMDLGFDVIARLVRQVDDVLAFANILDLDATRGPIDLKELISDLQSDLREMIDTNEADLTAQRLPTIIGSKAQIRALFLNLLTNALKFRHPKRRPQILISARSDHRTHRIWVQDNGIGIAPHAQQRIFHLFSRLNPSEGVAATGVGLALCRRVARNHGGDLTVTSRPGMGATFVLELPRDG